MCVYTYIRRHRENGFCECGYVRDLEKGRIILDYLVWPNVSQQSLMREMGGVIVGERDAMTEAESEVMSFEVGKDCKARNIGRHPKLRKARKQILSAELQNKSALIAPSL